jgi:hypothetical protein
VVRAASQTSVPDAPSGFRAISRRAAMQLHVFSEYTYTLETLIQAGQNRMAVTSVPIRVNGDLRPSRLVKSILSYVQRSVVVIGRIFVTYKPFAAFSYCGLLCFLLGLAVGLRFMWFYFAGEGQGHVQSVILSALLLGAGFFLFVTGIIADLISVNRKLLESVDVRLRRIELGASPSGLADAVAVPKALASRAAPSAAATSVRGSDATQLAVNPRAAGPRK